MGTASQYWNIWRIHPGSERVGYKQCVVPTAQEFITKKVLNSQNGNLQSVLFSYFQGKNSANVDNISRAQAGLSLRCYVSEPILKTCKKIETLFGGEKQFTYQDLLPFVLNDDGETLVIIDNDGKNQVIVDKQGEAKATNYKFFSVQVLQKFNPESKSSMSLDSWAYLQTKQNPEIKDFLSEFGFKNLSDWALLNRARPKQLDRLSERDRKLLEVFHAVYRRDRITQRQAGLGKCPDPSKAQLQEMLNSLQTQNIIINSTVELMRELKQVATQLRQYDIWSYREPLEIQDPDTRSYTPRADLPTNSLDELDVEKRSLLEFFYEQLKLALNNAIKLAINNRIAELQKSKKYAPLVQKLIPGLQLYYCQGKSIKDIVLLLGMTSWDQARRVLNPGELVSNVRALTLQQVLDRMLAKAQELGLTKIPPEPDYLKTIAEQIEAFADEEIFQGAAEEIRAGKNRSLNSVYAQQLKLIIANS
jgi:hypothetical protein